MSEVEKHAEYAFLLSKKIFEIFDEESESHISQEELMEGDNISHFFHALANGMPTHIFNKITGEKKNHLEFNHIANHLVFQYSKQVD